MGLNASLRYQWRGTFENLDVPALVAFAGSPGSMTGRLAGTVALAAAGVEPLQAMERARGTARVILTDGRVPGLDIVRTIVLAFGKPSGERPAGSGEAFTRLAASLAVAGPTLTTSDSDVGVPRSGHDGGGDAVAGVAGRQSSGGRDAVARAERAGRARFVPPRTRGRSDCRSRADRRHGGVADGLCRRAGRPQPCDPQPGRGRDQVVARIGSGSGSSNVLRPSA